MSSTVQVIICIFIELSFTLSIQVHGHEKNILQELTSYEIVHPELHYEGRRRRDLSTRTPSGHVDKAVLSLAGFGRRFELDVSKNQGLFSADYVERHFRQGREIVRAPDAREHCFYQGKVQDEIQSSVAISTCEGIEGLIFDGNQSFYVHPIKEHRTQTYHVMYRMEDLKLPEKHYDEPNVADGLPMKNIYSEDRHGRSRRNVETETKYVELVIANDYQQYFKFKKNISLTNHRAKMIANLVDSLYRKINVRVVLTMVDTWSGGDRITVDPDSDKCLDNFMKYRNNELSKKHKNDNAQLLTDVNFHGGTVGKAQLTAMCTLRSGGVVQDHSKNAAATAATFAHEMGHNFGMNHDKESCKCDSAESNQGCIMSAVARSTPSTEWSSCSIDDFKATLKKGLDSCLFNNPTTVFGDAICGNGFKEEGEECDCGTVEECKKYTDVCCNATTCKLHDFAECNDGPCCDKCKIKKAREVCREKLNECDLPELCTGKSELCPSNKYRQDGIECAGGKGLCYKGTCPTHDEQCDYLWGPEAESGPKVCYSVNLRGDYHGNCHRDGDTYYKCELKDIMCGSLQCTKVEAKLPIIGTQRSTYRHTFNTAEGALTCASASLSLGQDVPDPGMTREGTKCADHKVCLDWKCVDITDLTKDVKPCDNNCSDRGLCNHVGECFCEDCWGGEDCSERLPCGENENKNKEQPDDEEETGGANVAVIIVSLLMVIAVVAGILAFIFRDRLKQKWQHFRSSPGRPYETVKQTAPHRPSAPPAKRPTISVPTFQSTTAEVPVVTVSAKPYTPEPPSKRVSCPPTERHPPRPPVARRPESEASILDKPRLPPAPVRHAQSGPLKPPPTAKATGGPAKATGGPVRPRPPSLTRHSETNEGKPAFTSAKGSNNAPKPRPPPLPKHVKSGQDRPTSVPVKPSQIKQAEGRPFSVTGASPAKATPLPKHVASSHERPTSVPLKPSEIKQAQGRPSSAAVPSAAKAAPLPKHVALSQERPTSVPLKPSEIKQAQGRPSSVTGSSPASRAQKPIPPVPRKPPKQNWN